MSKIRKQPRNLVGKRDPNFRKGYVESFPKKPGKPTESPGKKPPKK